MNAKVGDRVLLRDGNTVEVMDVDGRWIDIQDDAGHRSWVLRDYVVEAVETN